MGTKFQFIAAGVLPIELLTCQVSMIALQIGQDSSIYHVLEQRDYEAREHIPVPHDNLFQSILSFAPLFLVSPPWPRGPWSSGQMLL